MDGAAPKPGRRRRRQGQIRASKNRLTIDQLALACKHVEEMRATGITENLAIRTLETFADLYAKMALGGTDNPHDARKIPASQWSVEAKKRKVQYPNDPSGKHFRVEHGTPRRSFARNVMSLYKKGHLTEQALLDLAKASWKLAVITLEEDAHLNRIARSRPASSPEERWRLAGIVFDENSN